FLGLPRAFLCGVPRDNIQLGLLLSLLFQLAPTRLGRKSRALLKSREAPSQIAIPSVITNGLGNHIELKVNLTTAVDVNRRGEELPRSGFELLVDISNDVVHRGTHRTDQLVLGRHPNLLGALREIALHDLLRPLSLLAQLLQALRLMSSDTVGALVEHFFCLLFSLLQNLLEVILTFGVVQHPRAPVSRVNAVGLGNAF